MNVRKRKKKEREEEEGTEGTYSMQHRRQHKIVFNTKMLPHCYCYGRRFGLDEKV